MKLKKFSEFDYFVYLVLNFNFFIKLILSKNNTIYLFLLFLLFLFSCSLNENNKKQDTINHTYKRILVKNKWGFVNEKGDTVIKPGKYDFMNPLNEKQMILVQKNNKYGYIDIHENIIIPIIYDKLGIFSEDNDLIYARKDQKYFFLNDKGEMVLGPYDFSVDCFSKSGLARIEKKGKIGFINKKGKIVIPPKYEYVIYNSIDTFVVLGINVPIKKTNSHNIKWGIFNNKGKALTGFIFDSIYQSTFNTHTSRETMAENGLILVRKNNKYAYLNKKLKIKIPYGKYDKALPFNENRLAIVSKNGKYGIIDEFGHEIWELKYDKIFHPNEYGNDEDFFIIQKNSKIGLLDQYAHKITDINNKEYFKDFVGIDSTTYIRIFRIKNFKNKFGVIDSKGNLLIPFIYDDIRSFYKKKYSIAKINNKYGVIDYHNKLLLPFKYNKLSFNNKKEILIAKNNNNKFGVIDLFDKIIIPFDYDSINFCCKEIKKDRYIVSKNRKFGLVNNKNKIIIPLKYDYLYDWITHLPHIHFIRLNNKYGIVTSDGQMLLKPIYDDLIFCRNFFKLKYKNKYGLYNFYEKKIFIKPKYDKIYLRFDPLENPFKFIKKQDIFLKKKNKYFTFDTNGNRIEIKIAKSELKKLKSYCVEPFLSK